MASGTNTVTLEAKDTSGNTTTKNYSLTVSGSGATYTYDANGNLSQKVEGGDTWVYTWNAENQLTKVEKNAAEMASFKYDPLGRRVEKAAGVTTLWTYDREDIHRETAGSTTLRFVHGPGIDEPLAADSGSGLSYYHADGLGSIGKTTVADGAVSTSRRYDAWGVIEDGAGVSGYSFTGREQDSETGLAYYRTRFYDAGGGRFLGQDPLRFRAGVNFYSYVLDHPTGLVDPFGLESGNINAMVPGPGPVPLSPWPKPLPKGPGCGTGFTEYLVPDAFIVDFQPACRIHDGCYDTCGASKTACDFGFADDLERQCQSAPNLLKPLCNSAGRLYLAGVHYGGGTPYTNAQRKCEPCENKDLVRDQFVCSGGICFMMDSPPF